MAKGDALASGGRSAQFPSAGGNVSQTTWDAIWAEDEIGIGETAPANKPAKDVAEVKARAGKRHKRLKVPK